MRGEKIAQTSGSDRSRIATPFLPLNHLLLLKQKKERKKNKPAEFISMEGKRKRKTHKPQILYKYGQKIITNRISLPLNARTQWKNTNKILMRV